MEEVDVHHGSLLMAESRSRLDVAIGVLNIVIGEY
jgi:hypothetical protein